MINVIVLLQWSLFSLSHETIQHTILKGKICLYYINSAYLIAYIFMFPFLCFKCIFLCLYYVTANWRIMVIIHHFTFRWLSKVKAKWHYVQYKYRMWENFVKHWVPTGPCSLVLRSTVYTYPSCLSVLTFPFWNHIVIPTLLTAWA